MLLWNSVISEFVLIFLCIIKWESNVIFWFVKYSWWIVLLFDVWRLYCKLIFCLSGYLFRFGELLKLISLCLFSVLILFLFLDMGYFLRYCGFVIICSLFFFKCLVCKLELFKLLICIVILVLCFNRLIMLLWLVILSVMLGNVFWNLFINGVSWWNINGFVVLIWSFLEGVCFNSCNVFLFFFNIFSLFLVYCRKSFFFFVNFSFLVVWFNRVIFKLFLRWVIVLFIFVICWLSRLVVLEKLFVFIMVRNVFKFLVFDEIGIVYFIFLNIVKVFCY